MISAEGTFYLPNGSIYLIRECYGLVSIFSKRPSREISYVVLRAIPQLDLDWILSMGN